MPDPILFPPNGFDRADGSQTDEQGNRIGTPTGDAVIFISQLGASFPTDAFFFEELPDSPIIERAEQATLTHRYACDMSTGQWLIENFKRGDIMEDTNHNITRVLSNTAQYQKPDHWIITMVSEGISFDNPPDLFSIQVIELNPDANKHPRYNDLTYADRYNIKHAVEIFTYPSDGTSIEGSFFDQIKTLPGAPAQAGQPPANPFAKTRFNEAMELVLKYFKGEDSFYLPGIRLQWSRYFWGPQYQDPGGYIEEPISEGGLPYYFWSIDGSTDMGGLAKGPNGDDAAGLWQNSWFGAMANINPTIYGNGLSWLRMEDDVDYERTWFKVTHTWQGGPLGHWDNEWYNIQPDRKAQPYQTLLDKPSVNFPAP